MTSIPDTQAHHMGEPIALPSAANDYWGPTTRRHPCPRCGHRGYCEVSVDGRWCHCMFAASDLAWNKRQGGYVHRLAEATGDDMIDQANRDATWAATLTPPAPCADADTLDAAYRTLHEHWPLTDEDLALLSGPRHGLSVGQARALCATVPDDTLAVRRALNALIDRFGVTATLAIPGFYLADNNHVAFAGRDLLFFRRDARGRVTGAQIRLRHPREGQPRYVYLTSTWYGGPTPGSAPHVARPLAGPRHGEVWVTEGIKKATIAADALGVPVVGLLGVGTWRQALDVVRELGAATVVIALDQDDAPRAAAMVNRCRQGLAQALARSGCQTILASWPAEVAKGVDDLIQRGVAPTLALADARGARRLSLSRPAGRRLPDLARPLGRRLAEVAR